MCSSCDPLRTPFQGARSGQCGAFSAGSLQTRGGACAFRLPARQLKLVVGCELGKHQHRRRSQATTARPEDRDKAPALCRPRWEGQQEGRVDGRRRLPRSAWALADGALVHGSATPSRAGVHARSHPALRADPVPEDPASLLSKQVVGLGRRTAALHKAQMRLACRPGRGEAPGYGHRRAVFS